MAYGNDPAHKMDTLVPSMHLVSITITDTFWSHTICQKSSTVRCRGPGGGGAGEGGAEEVWPLECDVSQWCGSAHLELQ